LRSLLRRWRQGAAACALFARAALRLAAERSARTAAEARAEGAERKREGLEAQLQAADVAGASMRAQLRAELGKAHAATAVATVDAQKLRQQVRARCTPLRPMRHCLRVRTCALCLPLLTQTR
jgi:hypothetical protein